MECNVTNGPPTTDQRGKWRRRLGRRPFSHSCVNNVAGLSKRRLKL